MVRLRNKVMLLYLTFFISACQSHHAFNIKTLHTDVDDLHIIQVASERVKQECIFLDAEAENKWRHLYLMHVLNNQNEVLEIMQPTHLDKETCEVQFRRIEKILQDDSQIKLCIRDELKKKNFGQNQGEMIHFSSLGKYSVAYETLTLDTICNSGKCFSNNSVWVNTCPGFVKE